MSRKLIHFNPDQAGQLRCDAPGCGYIEPKPQPFTAALIGKPCPRCRASLLTARDYRDTARLFRAIDWINQWFGWLGTERPTAKHQSVAIRTHAGQVEVAPRPANDRHPRQGARDV